MSQRPTRRQQAETILELLARGYTVEEIAARLNLRAKTVKDYARDPAGERVRAALERYRGTCTGCGAQTTGEGPNSAYELCPRCAAERRRRYSDAELLALIREWVALTGRAPRWADWSPAHAPAGHDGAARFRRERRWPGAQTVKRRFGSLQAAAAAAEVPDDRR